MRIAGTGYHEAVTGIAEPRILVLTLASGENELAECRRSVAAQRGGSTKHLLIEDMANAEAHAALYRTVVYRAGDADLFVKLDADMVLADTDVLKRIAGYFDQDPELDHLVLGVEDWFTDSTIIGVHAFSPRVRWRSDGSGLFTDPDPVFPGRKLVIEHPWPPVVFHGPDPSPFQAFFFGVHRAMKACQRPFDWSDRQLYGARTNWQALVRLWRHARRNPDPRLGLALWGADLVFRGRLPATAVNRSDPALIEAFELARQLTRDEIDSRLAPRWGSWRTRQMSWYRGMGLSMTLLVLGRGGRDVITAPMRALRRARDSVRISA